MSRSLRTALRPALRPTLSLTAVVVSGLLLAGCAAPAATGPTLASTKPSAQLLRNEIAGRVPPAVVDKLGETKDSSVTCGDAGKRRAWRSSIVIFVDPKSAWRLGTVSGEIISSLQNDGWTPKESKPSKKITQTTLEKAGTTAVINLIATEAVDGKGNGATYSIAADGPCVDTDGPDSDEVKQLEGRA